VIMLLTLEKLARRRARYANTTGLYHPLDAPTYGGVKGWLVAALCSLPALIGFVVPLIVLIAVSDGLPRAMFSAEILHYLGDSAVLASLTALVTVCVGFAIAHHSRQRQTPKWLAALLQVASLGYAIPGAVIAIGLLMILIALQQQVFGGTVLLAGSLIGLVWACSYRFLTISVKSFTSGYQHITPLMEQVATTLGASRWRVMRHLHLPLLKTSSVTAGLLVFVDTLKELPITLMLRPFDFTPLSVKIFELASDDLLPLATPYAMWLLAFTLIPVAVMHQKMSTGRPGERRV